MGSNAVSIATAVETRPCAHGFITELLLRCGRGDEVALGELFDLFHDLVSTVVARRVPPDRLESTVADVFVQLWRETPLYRVEGGSPVAWIMAHASVTLERAEHAGCVRSTG